MVQVIKNRWANFTRVLTSRRKLSKGTWTLYVSSVVACLCTLSVYVPVARYVLLLFLTFVVFHVCLRLPLKFPLRLCAIAILATGLMYFLWKPLIATIERRSYSKDSSEQKFPFTATIQEYLAKPTRSLDPPLWIKHAVDNRSLLSPTDIAIWLALTNDQDVPATISEVTVQVENAQGILRRLIKLPAYGASVYAGTRGQPASQVLNTSDFLDNALNGRTLQPHQTITGWMFFDFPKGDFRLAEYPHFVVKIGDYSGSMYTSPKIGRAGSQDSASMISFQFSGVTETLCTPPLISTTSEPAWVPLGEGG
jgi:hypothetical protein